MPLGSLSCCQRFALCAGLCPISHIFNEGSEHHWPRVVKVDFFFSKQKVNSVSAAFLRILLHFRLENISAFFI